MRFQPADGLSLERNPALIGGQATFGPMSRTMKSDEIAAFEKQYGYKPTALPTSMSNANARPQTIDSEMKSAPANRVG